MTILDSGLLFWATVYIVLQLSCWNNGRNYRSTVLSQHSVINNRPIMF